MTSVHRHDDVRIFHKECVSLAKAGYETHFVVPGTPGNGSQGVFLHGVPRRSGSRLTRFLITTIEVLRTTLHTHPGIAHFHDPELLPIGVLLRLLGRKVIYDAHEDVAKSILTKSYIPLITRKPLARIVDWMEQTCSLFFDAIVAATPAIGLKFPPQRTVVVRNMPIVEELRVESAPRYRIRRNQFLLIGGISRQRGIIEMVRALEQLPESSDARLVLLGEIRERGLEESLRSLHGWARVDHVGFVAREHTARFFHEARAGILTFLPSPNHIEALPNKLFEYMAAGLPLIASDFPLWRKILEPARCALFVDPEDPTSIRKAMEWILGNEQEAEEMGNRAIRLVQEEFNWEIEKSKLLNLYARLSADLARQTEHPSLSN